MPETKPPSKNAKQRAVVADVRDSMRLLREPRTGNPTVAKLADEIDHLKIIIRYLLTSR